MLIVLKSPKLSGNCELEGFEKGIILTSCDFGVSRSVSNAEGYSNDRVRGVASGSYITITKDLGLCDLDLYKETFNGRGEDISIHYLKQSGSKVDELLSIELGDAMFCNFKLNSQGPTPTIDLTVSYTRIILSQHTYDAEDKSCDVKRLGVNYESSTLL